MNQFKKCKVVMLPTNEKATDKPFSIGITICNDGKLRIGNPVGNSESRQHLYITSDEEIKVGDYSIGDEGIFGPYEKGDMLPNNSKKIIVTTDTSLKFGEDVPGIIRYKSLPQPSQQFIEKYIEEYNKSNIIADILVEYEEASYEKWLDNEGSPVFDTIKVNSKDNTITIKKVKDNYSQKKVNELFEKYDFEIKRFGILDEWKYNHLENWKKENL